MKYSILFLVLLSSCLPKNNGQEKQDKMEQKGVELRILGTVQDAGSPHIACIKGCCKDLSLEEQNRRKVVSLAVIDHDNKINLLFEASPDMPHQLKLLKEYSNTTKELPDAIFITHAHIGHYTGLMYLGKEATNAKEIPVYSMPRMHQYLSNHGPWSQLVQTKNIVLNTVSNKDTIQVSPLVKVIPFRVPHRDEYSETVGFKIIGPNKSLLFIPDIDKWEKWDQNITKEVKSVNYAFLDATFYDGEEINNRDIKEIPHPFVIESMEKFKELSEIDKNKIHFIHFNHTNPLLIKGSSQQQSVASKGFNVSKLGDSFRL